MPLIIEDGSLVQGANSYLTLVELREWASSRGVVFPTDDTELEVLAVKAVDYLETFAEKYKGTMTDPTIQTLQWPRVGVKLYGVYLEGDAIPGPLKKAQFEAASALMTGEILADSQPIVKKQKVDIIETEYFEPTLSSSGVDVSKVDAALRPLMSSGFAIEVQRA